MIELNGSEDSDDPAHNRCACLRIALDSALETVAGDFPKITYAEIIGTLELFKADVIRESQGLDDDEGEGWKIEV